NGQGGIRAAIALCKAARRCGLGTEEADRTDVRNPRRQNHRLFGGTQKGHSLHLRYLQRHAPRYEMGGRSSKLPDFIPRRPKLPQTCAADDGFPQIETHGFGPGKVFSMGMADAPRPLFKIAGLIATREEIPPRVRGQDPTRGGLCLPTLAAT